MQDAEGDAEKRSATLKERPMNPERSEDINWEHEESKKLCRGALSCLASMMLTAVQWCITPQEAS